MARTVASVAGRGERGAGKKVRRERVEAGKGLEENMLGGREENLVEIFGRGTRGREFGRWREEGEEGNKSFSVWQCAHPFL